MCCVYCKVQVAFCAECAYSECFCKGFCFELSEHFCQTETFRQMCIVWSSSSLWLLGAWSENVRKPPQTAGSDTIQLSLTFVDAFTFSFYFTLIPKTLRLWFPEMQFLDDDENNSGCKYSRCMLLVRSVLTHGQTVEAVSLNPNLKSLFSMRTRAKSLSIISSSLILSDRIWSSASKVGCGYYYHNDGNLYHGLIIVTILLWRVKRQSYFDPWQFYSERDVIIFLWKSQQWIPALWQILPKLSDDRSTAWRLCFSSSSSTFIHTTIFSK